MMIMPMIMMTMSSIMMIDNHGDDNDDHDFGRLGVGVKSTTLLCFEAS